MKIAIFCFSAAGCRLAGRLCARLSIPKENVHTTAAFAGMHGFMGHRSVCSDVGDAFATQEALIFIGACGIAVRAIAPHIKSKTTDPAVLCIDEGGTFVIPILSGHIGGANRLAGCLADLLDAAAVITTATDIHGRFSCDAWAAQHGCALSSLAIAKEISARILTKDIPISAEFPLPDILPQGLIPAAHGALGIYIGVKKEFPYTNTLRLIPKIVTLGIGCRRGTPWEKIDAAVNAVFAENAVDPRAVCRVASIDVKRDETGLLAYAEQKGLPLAFFTTEELAAVSGEFDESEFVRRTVGVGNVCERAATCRGETLFIRKSAVDGVTVAAAVRDWKIEFESSGGASS